jgi:hypothetical protein
MQAAVMRGQMMMSRFSTDAGERGTDAPTTTKLLTGLEDKDQEPH